jgi:hypothetical protein
MSGKRRKYTREFREQAWVGKLLWIRPIASKSLRRPVGPAHRRSALPLTTRPLAPRARPRSTTQTRNPAWASAHAAEQPDQAAAQNDDGRGHLWSLTAIFRRHAPRRVDGSPQRVGELGIGQRARRGLGALPIAIRVRRADASAGVLSQPPGNQQR